MQERLLEEQLGTHRKTKKALSAKQRTAKKAGRALAEDDAAQLRRVVEQQAAVQKQLEQVTDFFRFSTLPLLCFERVARRST